MARPVNDDVTRMTRFARWLVERMAERDTNLVKVAAATKTDYSYLFKIKKSYLPQYYEFQRPGPEKTRAIGEFLGDVDGALVAAGHSNEETK